MLSSATISKVPEEPAKVAADFFDPTFILVPVGRMQDFMDDRLERVFFTELVVDADALALGGRHVADAVAIAGSFLALGEFRRRDETELPPLAKDSRPHTTSAAPSEAPLASL